MAGRSTYHDGSVGEEAEGLINEVGFFDMSELQRLEERMEIVRSRLQAGETGIHLLEESTLLEKMHEIFLNYLDENDPEIKEELRESYRTIAPGVFWLASKQLESIQNREIRASSNDSTNVSGNDTIH
jgi:hypothetical protein